MHGAIYIFALPEEHGMPFHLLSPTAIVVTLLILVALAVAAVLAWKVSGQSDFELQQIYANAPLGFEWQEFNTSTFEVTAQGFCSYPIRPPQGPSRNPGHAFRSWPVESHSRLWATLP
ncbi:hypothetical protein [Acidovorax sp. sic0104]|uniref:hypothetical protein n=1 Tax=Acidovorax sp. sic0104 TaxID=2854784 RepID=UPI001C44EA5C|nr:hypothetical protein [Acidovorax sp. sic0104]MBV7542058.1 hypothetical protein [Acidovorax sp. sic0104]